MWFRRIGPIILAATTMGCGQYGVSGPNDLGLVEQLKPRLNVEFIPSPSTVLTDGVRRNQELSKWIVVSDDRCNKYLLQLSRGIRDSRLATDVVGTVLSGLATILAPVGTKTALSGAATITLGVGGDFQSDLFAQQAGEVLISAVQTVRTRARKDLQEKMRAPYESYTLEQGLVDIQRYDQETCNLNIGLNELRASLIVGLNVERPNNPILPLPEPLPTPIVQLPPLPTPPLGPPPDISPPPQPVKPRPRPTEHVERDAPIPVGTLTPDQIAFDAAIGKLKHDPAKPKELAPESRQTVDECIQPQFRKGTSLARVMLTAKADLSRITSCIVNKSQ